jgi:hypothetical protein
LRRARQVKRGEEMDDTAAPDGFVMQVSIMRRYKRRNIVRNSIKIKAKNHHTYFLCISSTIADMDFYCLT